MTAQILPAKSGGLTQVQNSLRVSQTFATCLGNATDKNHAGQSGMPSDIGNTEKPLTLTICNKYVSNMAWCSLVVVVAHTSEISVMLHAACNGAVCAPSVGVMCRRNRNSTPRRPSMVLLVGECSRSLVNLLSSIPIPASNTASIAGEKNYQHIFSLMSGYGIFTSSGWCLRSPFNLKLPPVSLRLTFRDFKYSSRANSIVPNSESSGESLSGFMVMTCALFWVSICCSYLVFLPLLSRSFNRHASITHAEKFRDFSSSSAAAICSSILYEKRMFFVAVLLVFGFFGMATPRVVWCFVDNFRQGEVNVIDLYQDNLSELTQTEAVKKHLRTHNGLGYVNAAPYKTGVGIGTPCKQKATPDAESVFFVVRYTRYSMAWYAIQQQSYNRRSTALLSYHAANNGAVCSSYAGVVTHSGRLNSTPRRQRMVTLAGQPQGWPVSFCAGSSNPVNVTTPIEIGTSSGDSLNQQKEAA